MPAKFEKPLIPLFRDHIDGFDKKTQYQMMPVRDKREMGVVTDSEDCLLRVNDPSVARLANFWNSSGLLPARAATDRIVLSRKSQVAFSILGREHRKYGVGT